MLTGANSPPTDSTHNHALYFSGTTYARGTPLGVPYATGAPLRDNGEDRLLSFTNSYSTNQNTRTVNIWSQPFFVPRAEESLYCRFVGSMDPVPAIDVYQRCRFELALYDGTMVLITSTVMEHVDVGQNLNRQRYWQGVLNLPTSAQGTVCYLFIKAKYIDERMSGYFFPPMFSFRKPKAFFNLSAPRLNANDYDVQSQTDAASRKQPAFTEIDDSQFADGYPISSWLVYEQNRNANTLEEWLTGAPAGNQKDYVFDIDSYHSHSIDSSERTDGGIVSNIDFPIWSTCFGACEDAAYIGYPSTTKQNEVYTLMTYWDAPRIKYRSPGYYQLDFLHASMKIPPLSSQSGSASARQMQLVILATSTVHLGVYTATQSWHSAEVIFYNDSNTASTARRADFVRLGSSIFYAATFSTSATPDSGLGGWQKTTDTYGLTQLMKIKIRYGYDATNAQPTPTSLVGDPLDVNDTSSDERMFQVVGACLFHKGS